jgi:sugar transferase (PEP-CTERM/EpsH1 system associated)
MRILFITARLPYPPNRGDRLRAFNFIKSLSKDHEIHLLSFITDENEKDNIEALKAMCKEVQVVRQSKLRSILAVAFNLWRALPLQALYYRSGMMQRLIDETLANESFDLIYVHLFRMAPFVQHVKNIYRIVDLTDVISREIKRSLGYRGLLSRILYGLEYGRIRKYEREVSEKFEEIWLISGADKQELAMVCPNANIQVVSNGVDASVFYPNGSRAQPHSMMFSGHFGVAHNIDAARLLAEQILPQVQTEFPDSVLRLVGAEPAQEVLKLDELPGVQVTGYVQDLNEYLNRAAVFVAPLRFAAGIQNKVLEAMAAGRPVVTTSIVNEGLGAKTGEELIVADTAEEMARQIGRLMHEPEMADKLGEAAQHFVRAKFSWENVLRRVEQIKATQERAS